MSDIVERLQRLHAAQHGSTAVIGLPDRRTPWLGAAIALLIALVVTVVIAWAFFVTVTTPPGAVRTPRPSLADVSRTLGFNAHALADVPLAATDVVPPTTAKSPRPGAVGAQLTYLIGGQQVNVFEYADPSPSSPLTIDPQTQAAATAGTIGNRPALLWTTANGQLLTQVEFKTADGLLIFIAAPARGLDRPTVTYLAGEL